MLLTLPCRSDRVPVFSAAVPDVAQNRGSVRPAWKTTLAHSYHSELNATFYHFFVTLQDKSYSFHIGSHIDKSNSVIIPLLLVKHRVSHLAQVEPCSLAISTDSFVSNWVPYVPVRADVLLCGLGRFPEFQHVPFVSSNWGHL